MTTPTDETREARHRIAVAAGAALLAAGLILVMFILPAEYAVDPLGTGARFGLLELGATGQQIDALAAASTTAGQTTVVAAQEKPFHSDTASFTLPALGSIEYKYRLDKGESLLYSWTATG